MDTVGIDTIRETVIAAAKLANTIDSSLEDSKITPIEWGKIGLSGFKFAKGIAKFKQLKVEFKDLSEPEKEIIVNDFVSEFDLRNNEAEVMAEDAFSALLLLSGLVIQKE